MGWLSMASGWIWLRSASISFGSGGVVPCVAAGWFVLACAPRGGCPGLRRRCGELRCSRSGLAAPVAAFRRLVPWAVSGSDENSLGNRGGAAPVLRRIYFFLLGIAMVLHFLGEKDGFF